MSQFPEQNIRILAEKEAKEDNKEISGENNPSNSVGKNSAKNSDDDVLFEKIGRGGGSSVKLTSTEFVGKINVGDRGKNKEVKSEKERDLAYSVKNIRKLEKKFNLNSTHVNKAIPSQFQIQVASEMIDDKSPISVKNKPSKMSKLDSSELIVNYKTFIKARNYKSLVSEYNIGSSIGQGSFGRVQKVVHKQSGQIRAMKVIMKEGNDNFDEINNLIRLNHPNIIKLYEYFHDNKNIYIIMEYYPGGELFEKIKEREFFNEKEAAIILKSILQAIGYCHSQGIVHRDLKSENILLQGDDLSQLKIIDFGTSIRKRKKKEKIKGCCGSIYYMAPEVLLDNYNEKCDIWSIGVIGYILFTGKPPFNGGSEKEIANKIIKGRVDYNKGLFSSISSEGVDFIKRLLKKDIRKRISALDALQHPWIKNLAKNAKFNSICTKRIFRNLKNFSEKSKFQEAVITFIMNQLMSDEEIKQLKQMFLEIDENGDGVLTKDELHRGLVKVYGETLTKEASDEIFEKIDTDGNGTISYDEFIKASADEKNILNEEKLKLAYKLFDKNGDGNIEACEIKEVLGSINDTDDNLWEQLIKEADLDGNGLIDYEEFKVMMKKLFLN